MYSVADFRTDWRRLLAISVAGLVLLLGILVGVDEIELANEIRTEPGEFAGGCAAIVAYLFFCLLAYRTVAFIRHKGWQRTLVVLAVTAFLLAFLGLNEERRIGFDDILEYGLLGALLAAVTIIVPQLVYSRILWIRRGFKDPAARQ